MENNYYNLQLISGKDLIEYRTRVQDDDRYIRPRFYAIEDIQPDKYYMASIIDEDLSEITAIYIEEIVYEKGGDK